MQRGKRKFQALNNSILPETQAALFPQLPTNHYEEKVELLIARYTFYITNGTRRDEILSKLEKEFFISSGRISDILISKSDEIKKLQSEAPKPSWFKMKWTHLVW